MTMQEEIFGQEVAGKTAASLLNLVGSFAASWARSALAFAQKVGIARRGLLIGTAGVAVWLLGWSRNYLVELAQQAPSWIALSIPDIVGFLASALVLATFVMTDMRTLRLVAIFSNLAFIAYAAIAWLPPVLCLHIVLLPVNLVRLAQTRNSGASDRARAG